MVETITPGPGETFDIELEEDLLRANNELAEQNRKLLDEHGILGINVMGSIGTGKTTLISRLVRELGGSRVAVFTGDLTTTIDADLIGESGGKVVQINTGKECHLDANLVKKALDRIDLDTTEILIIENVGNLICPAEFPLGAHRKLVLISCTEGPHMVLKHPFIFREADVVSVNKIDMAEAMGLEVEKLEGDLAKVNPKAKAVRTNAREGLGMAELVAALGL
ncbi:MAG: hydrogenase nickel incorporation protein HypB [Methanopyri archaeon]|jgi:hydrogenase nickel incorporation protein HypB|nr:hydrogenase nickel incorporation protein HypB [Methanopyri archaeon]